MRKDGTVVAVGANEDAPCRRGQPNAKAINTQGWHDIIAISAGKYHTVGLRKDGTVVAVGRNSERQCDTQDWHDIIAVSAGRYHTVGLKKDGTLCGTSFLSNYSGWQDWSDIGLVLNDLEFAQNHGARETVCEIAQAVGGVDNIRTCDLRFWKEGTIRIYVNNRNDVNISALNETGAEKVTVETVISTITYDARADASYKESLFEIFTGRHREITKQVDCGEGIVNMRLLNVDFNIKNEFEVFLPPNKLGIV